MIEIVRSKKIIERKLVWTHVLIMSSIKLKWFWEKRFELI